MTETTEPDPKQALVVAEQLVANARRDLDGLTVKGWNLAYAQAVVGGRLNLARRIDMAKQLAVYAGGED